MGFSEFLTIINPSQVTTVRKRFSCASHAGLILESITKKGQESLVKGHKVLDKVFYLWKGFCMQLPHTVP